MPRADGKISRDGVVRPGQHGTTQVAPCGQAVDPGHRVPVGVLVLGQTGHAGIEIICPFGVDEHGRRLDRQQPQDCLEDHAGKAHATTGRPEDVITLRGAALDKPCRSCDSQVVEVPADGAVDVVVLAVDVTRDGTAERDEACPGRHGRESPLGTSSLRSSSTDTPASARHRCPGESRSRTRFRPVQSTTRPPPH